MEKTAMVKSKNKILMFLPKAAHAAVSLQNLQYLFSPGRSKYPDLNLNKNRADKGYISGPIVSMAAMEARRNNKNSEMQEPISPKVSCMGQIKHRKKICKRRQTSVQKEFDFKPFCKAEAEKVNKIRPAVAKPVLKRNQSGIPNIFRAGRNSDASIDRAKPLLIGRAPSLSHMKKFASCRDSFANFDWKSSQIAPEDEVDFDTDKEDNDEEDDLNIPYSEPISIARGTGGLDSKPRMEINLWKRRIMNQPKPLQLNLIIAQ